MEVKFTILGQPQSKANSRKIVVIQGRPASIKSASALAYERDAIMQIPPRAKLMLEGPLKITIRIWYPTQRQDLDESLILDVLQTRYAKGGQREIVTKGVYLNDRQIREKHVYHSIDKQNPRADIHVEQLQTAETSQPDSTGGSAA